jgi:glutamyl/glutaminyl-tRNA synthetase
VFVCCMIRSRLAPTPSGFLHKGNAFNFLLAAKVVGKTGELTLRIDDLDKARVKPEYIKDVFDTIKWLEIEYQVGPNSINEYDKYSQLNKLPVYHQYINQLKEQGDLFACNCSRSMLMAYPVYPGTCLHKNLPFTDDAAWRLTTPDKSIAFYDDFRKKEVKHNVLHIMPYPVIKRKNGFPAYQLASLVDDVMMNINCIVRGEDLIPSTIIQLYMAQLLNFNSFVSASFYHHPLLMDNNGQKLSKSAGSYSIKKYRDTHSFRELKQEFNAWVNQLKL